MNKKVRNWLQSSSSEPSAQSLRWSHLRLKSTQPTPLLQRNLSRWHDVTLTSKAQSFSSAPSRQSRNPSHFFSAGMQMPVEHSKSVVWQLRNTAHNIHPRYYSPQYFLILINIYYCYSSIFRPISVINNEINFTRYKHKYHANIKMSNKYQTASKFGLDTMFKYRINVKFINNKINCIRYKYKYTNIKISNKYQTVSKFGLDTMFKYRINVKFINNKINYTRFKYEYHKHQM